MSGIWWLASQCMTSLISLLNTKDTDHNSKGPFHIVMMLLLFYVGIDSSDDDSTSTTGSVNIIVINLIILYLVMQLGPQWLCTSMEYLKRL